MFNDRFRLTDAVLEGRKTQTRRFPSPRLIDKYNDLVEEFQVASINVGVPCSVVSIEDFLLERAPYKVGEIVAVAQSYDQVIRSSDEKKQEEVFDYMHRCGFEGLDNKMFVKPELMPHQIKITNVRVQRLQEITDEECIKEGISDKDWEAVADYCRVPIYLVPGGGRDEVFASPRFAYASLIDKISGKGTWDSNPYVFVYDFELVR